MSALLTKPQLEKSLESLPHWSFRQERGGLICREYRFRNFVDAFEFMKQMADFSEALGHHPEWRNVYRQVDVVLTTHDAGGLTDLDVAWASKADVVAQGILGQGPNSATLG